MKMNAKYVVAAAGLALALAAQPVLAQTVTLTIPDTSATIGGEGNITVNISGISGEGVVNNAQLDVLIPTSVYNPATGGTPPAVVGCVATRFPTSAGFNPTSSLPTSPAPPEGTRRLRLSVIDGTGAGRITNGELYTCNLPILGTATAGTYELQATRLNVGDTAGGVLPSEGVNGDVIVGTGPTATPTPPPPTNTATATATPTATNTSPVTSTPTSTSTPTRTRTPTITNTRKPSNDEDDGCQMVAPATAGGQAGWLLLIPAAVLIWRKRSR